MSSSPLHWIRDHLLHEGLTPRERADMRSYLLSYATQHPVKSGLFSPYFFTSLRVATTSVAAILVLLVGVTTQAQHALPYQSLYPLKIWIEDFQSGLQKTPQDKIAFEMGRINQRFQEATTLAVHDQGNSPSNALLQEKLLASRDTVRTTAESLAESDPTVALQAFDQLATSFTSNGKVLATITARTGTEVNPLVLAAHETTQQLNTEKKRFEKIIIAQETIPAPEVLEKRLTDLRQRVEKITPPSETLPVPSSESKDSAQPTLLASAPQVQETIQKPLPEQPLLLGSEPLGTAETLPQELPLTSSEEVNSSSTVSLAHLLQNAQDLFSQQKYKETFVALQHLEQQLDEMDLTQKLEKTYQVTPQKTP